MQAKQPSPRTGTLAALLALSACSSSTADTSFVADDAGPGTGADVAEPDSQRVAAKDAAAPADSSDSGSASPLGADAGADSSSVLVVDASSDALADETGPSLGLGDGGPCGVLPVNPKATQQAKNLLCYLYSQYGNHVLAGQQETSWSNPDEGINYIFTNTGKYPVVRGGDFLYPNGTTARAQAWWTAGGIPMLCYHMGAPPQSDTYAASMTGAAGGINAVLTPGTASNASFMQKLDYAAGELLKLQAANVAVLWRPFHEAQGNWFWWSKETGAQYVRLWTFMYDYFTNTKGLNNLVWLHPYDGTPQSSFYPGKAYVDIGGADTYSTNQPFASLFATTRGIVGTTVPIALHENGAMPNPASMFAGNAAPWLLFNTWPGFITSANSLAFVKSVYANPSTVTRDRVPSLK
ncbi:MAG: glycoside hydrolase family 26 protein [Myxococcota bacterium]|nr:glycoside hydrolase family 26 protein [Myxococcota bacterium]